LKYYIQRELQEYGPYTLADLQRYVAAGNILLTDLTRSEGMTEWTPVSQVLGTIPIPAPAPMPAMQTPQFSAYGMVPNYGTTGTVYGGASSSAAAAMSAAQLPVLVPPDLHWAVVLVVSFLTGLFPVIWLFIEASFVKKLDRNSNFMGFLVGGLVAPVLAVFFLIFAVAAAEASGSGDRGLLGFVALGCMAAILAGTVLQWVGIFKMRTAIEDYYNTVEPIQLRLSGVMTFFFSVFYFQYHFTRIAQWKATGYLEPQ